ncbi:MAG: TRAP transporter small permease subunit [Gammaproteobacteria bacterium]|nr:TRAP transporter small permease subunit [Gammaproteobacteria bacterium]
MKAMLALAKFIDAISTRCSYIGAIAVTLSVLISSGNAIVRFIFSDSSNAWLEIQWYLFAVCVMLGAPVVLKLNEHVRVDILYNKYPLRKKVWFDIAGTLVFLLPVIAYMTYLTWGLFIDRFHTGEMSSNAGGLIRWPVWLFLPLGFGLLFLQGIAEIIKRWAWLRGEYEMNLIYERPLQ